MLPLLFIQPRLARSSDVANIKSAKKRAVQAAKRNAHNSSVRSMLRTAIKKVVKAIDAKDQAGAEAALQAAVPVIDRISAHGHIHKNKAARHKSRLTIAIRKLSAGEAASA
jgi:small subunit ribosomal protein S20